MGNKSADAVTDRLLQVYGIKSDNQLSDLLKIKRSTLGNWRSRDSVPYAICVMAAEEKGISLDWLLTGKGPMRRDDASPSADSAADDPQERSFLALWRELDDAAQQEVRRVAEDKKRLAALEQRLSELEAVVADSKRLA